MNNKVVLIAQVDPYTVKQEMYDLDHAYNDYPKAKSGGDWGGIIIAVLIMWGLYLVYDKARRK